MTGYAPSCSTHKYRKKMYTMCTNILFTRLPKISVMRNVWKNGRFRHLFTFCPFVVFNKNFLVYNRNDFMCNQFYTAQLNNMLIDIRWRLTAWLGDIFWKFHQMSLLKTLKNPKNKWKAPCQIIKIMIIKKANNQTLLSTFMTLV